MWDSAILQIWQIIGGVPVNQETVTLKIPGLTRTYTFFHTSDTHVVLGPETEQDANAHANALLDAIHTADEAAADGIFLCGDIGDYFTKETIRFIRETLQESKTEVFYVMGNHECTGAENVEAAKKEFADMMFGNHAFWSRDLGELLIVGLDNSGKVYTEEQFAFLNEQIAKNKPILLLMHAPLWTEAIEAPVVAMWNEEMQGQECYYFLIEKNKNPENCRRRFWDLVQNPDNHIEAIFAGHIHLSNDSEYAPGHRQYTMDPTYTGKIRKVIVTG